MGLQERTHLIDFGVRFSFSYFCQILVLMDKFSTRKVYQKNGSNIIHMENRSIKRFKRKKAFLNSENGLRFPTSLIF